MITIAIRKLKKKLLIFIEKTVCSEPPDVQNARLTGPTYPTNGSVYNYTCVDGYLPYGGQSSIKCMPDLTYSLSESELLKCGKICKLKTNCYL